ncbi:MAG: hypothetical protein ABJC39_10710 [Chloroflexota bacterium]
MDEEPRVVRVQARVERPREPWIVVVAMGAFLVFALLKPWSIGREDGTPRGSTDASSLVSSPPSAPSVTVAAPSTAATPAIPDPNAMACLTDAVEQVVTIERWAGNEVRSWVASTDVTSSGPLDRRLIPLAVFSNHVVGLGICAPKALVGGGGPAARILDVVAIVPGAGGQRTIDLGAPEPATLRPSGPEPAILYGSPVVAPQPGPSADPVVPEPSTSVAPSAVDRFRAPSDVLKPWPTGAYAIAFRFPSDGPAIVHWLRIDLIAGAAAPG